MERRILFDIKFRSDIEAGKYLVKQIDGDSVKILCWDGGRDGDKYPIYALIESEGEPKYVISTFTLKGEFDRGHPGSYDLVLVPNPDYKEPIVEPSETAVWAAMAAFGAKFTNYEGWYQCRVTFLRHEQPRDTAEIWDRGETPYEAALGVYKQLMRVR